MTCNRLTLTFSLAALIISVIAQTPDLVIEIFRHGARGPLKNTYNPNQTYWGDNLGQLTPIGMRMHYLLGAALRNQYSELLTSYGPDTIYVRSSDYNRTIMSGYSHMYGVYETYGPNFTSTNNVSAAIPPYVSPYISELVADLSTTSALPNNFQVVPIHVVPYNEDILIAPYGPACAMAKNWSAADYASPETKSLFKHDMKDIVTYLRNQGLTVRNFKDLFFVGDTAIANMVEGIELPGNVDPVTQEQYYKDLKFAYEWYTTQTIEGTPNQVELFALNLLDFISGNINATINGTSSLNFIFLSGHDTTVLALLSAFNITTADCLLDNYRNDKNGLPIETPNCIYPQFAANLIFEFYNTEEPYVLFYYNGTQVPFCGNSNNNCTYKQFQSYITQVTGGLTPADYVQMCSLTQLPIPTTSDTDSFKAALIAVAIVAFVLVTLLSVMAFRMYKRNKELQKQAVLLSNQSQSMLAIVS